MAELVVTPPLEPSENRMKSLLGMAFELPINADVAGVADFLGQVGGVENVFRLEVGVCLGTLQITQINPQTKVLE